MDKALKQRLVGASVIIALAVIVLPMLLSGKPESGSEQSQKMEIQPRPDELSFETRRFPVIDVREDEDAGATASAGSDSTQQKLPTLPTVKVTTEADKADPAAMQQTSSNGVDTHEDANSPSPVDPDAMDAGRPAAPVLEPPSALPDTQTGKTPAPATSPTAPKSKVEDQPAGARYVVQVASLSSAQNAGKLVSRLQKQGFEVQLDTIESDVGRLNRVRVGPFAKETEAAAASARIGQEYKGVSPRVLDLQPGLASQVTNPADPLVRWVIQLGVFNEQANAQKLVDQLRDDGMTAYDETIKTPASTTYRVRVGPFLERDEAIRTQQQLSDQLKIDGVVMSAD